MNLEGAPTWWHQSADAVTIPLPRAPSSTLAAGLFIGDSHCTRRLLSHGAVLERTRADEAEGTESPEDQHEDDDQQDNTPQRSTTSLLALSTTGQPLTLAPLKRASILVRAFITHVGHEFVLLIGRMVPAFL